MISTRNKINPLKRKKNKTGEIGFLLGTKTGMKIKGNNSAVDKFIEPFKKY